MTDKTLANYFTLHRRYSRSINLERDLERPEALEGYILTSRAKEALARIGRRENHSWTLTSVYGTGKSSFAHFLSSLCAPEDHPLRAKALEIAARSLGSDNPLYKVLKEDYPEKGYVRAVATGRREPIGHTIVRALYFGTHQYWEATQRPKISVISKLADLDTEISSGNTINTKKIPELVLEVARASETGVFLILDELGKNLEYASYNLGQEDLYLLQQLAELPKHTDTPIYILGILHQAFTDYGQRLASKERNEWAKIQGRFENISFAESSGEVMRLIGETIDATGADGFQCAITHQAREWYTALSPLVGEGDLTETILAGIYPLHPLTALVLPILCQRYAQNDRSLFTFLTSSEPYSFKNFLTEVKTEGDHLPTLKLDRLYDYFIEAVGAGLTSRPHLQRWVEIQEAIADARDLSVDTLRVLKTIGILNLITTTGTMRATKRLVTLAMSDIPSDLEQNQYWEQIIQELFRKNHITHRRQLDELRIWQGSDFNIDSELVNYLEQERSPLVNLLTTLRPLAPLVAQRHSYTTGTLRFFERVYVDSSTPLARLECSSADRDGLIGYWVDEKSPDTIPQYTADGKPLIVLCGSNLEVLRTHTLEFTALRKIQTTARELQTDGVARKEMRYRVVEAERLLDETLDRAFRLENHQNACWMLGERESIARVTEFKAKLSAVCDQVYCESPTLRNELINRRELTSQGAKARRELIEAMVERGGEERLGLQGYGPEVSMYYSLLEMTGIYRRENEEWQFHPPAKSSGLRPLWRTIEDFCLEASDKLQSLEKLYQKLAAPPYGVKQGPIPVILAAVLLYHVEDIGVYKDGTFIPLLGAEHFEILLKDPSRFSVKYFEMVGSRSRVFKELEAILRDPSQKKTEALRNSTLLTVVTPLYRFVKKLPDYTKRTERVSKEARAVLKALQQTVEPDELIFTELPIACNLSPIGTEETDDGEIARNLRDKLVQVIREIHSAYDNLLGSGRNLLHDAFGIRGTETKLREDLRTRAKYIVDRCVDRGLKSFVLAAIDEGKSDREWLEALMMIVADKPPESWKDEDITKFEMNLADVSRRFNNLEAIQKEVVTGGDGREARRITVTRPDGQETHRLVWVDNESEEQVEKYVREILNLLPDNDRIRQSVLAKLTERILNSEIDEEATSNRVGRSLRQGKTDEGKRSKGKDR
ncbi:hypothetical protein V0288_11425 [Pannus brasiliensis CCIBt3594]|uniref:ATP-binding protein n=1 Tax=Pannus brasiliensis CCIBt3594 TaxID=1427578 RepID=A0AAW9QIV5_9CHRO